MLGGRAAALPEAFQRGSLDLAGFGVGVVERHKIAANARPAPGDCAIALASSGLHAHGFSLARRVLQGKAGLALTDTPGELEGATLAAALLAPTRIYGPNVLDVLSRYRVKKVVKAMAHVKAGGLPAAVAAALMYFATLTEVPIVSGLIAAGMGKGPALAMLLAGPSVSLPAALVLCSILGLRKTLAYVLLVILFATLAGVAYGSL